MAVQDALKLDRRIPGVGTIEFVQTPSRREYWFTPEDGKRRQRMPSVTSILRQTWPKPGLLEWYAKHGRETETLLEVAAARGTRIHAFVEAYMTGGELSDEHPPEDEGYLRAAARFLYEHDPRPIAVERLIVHPELHYAGRLDLIATVDGLPTLLDFKSNPQGRVYPEAHVQAAAYALADERCGGEPVARTMVVGLAQDGRYNPTVGSDARGLWGSLLELYRAKQRFEKELGP